MGRSLPGMKPKELCYHQGLVAHSFSLEDTQQMQVGWSMTQRTVWVLSVLGLAIFAAADTSRAQMRLWEDTGYLNINYLYQAKNRSFQETISQSIYDETATYTATHKIGGGGWLRCWWWLSRVAEPGCGSWRVLKVESWRTFGRRADTTPVVL